MATVAVAGGTGSVGKTIVDAIVEAGKHEVVLLTRQVCKQSRNQDCTMQELTIGSRARMVLLVLQNMSSTTLTLSTWLVSWKAKRFTRSSQPLQSYQKLLAIPSGP